MHPKKYENTTLPRLSGYSPPIGARSPTSPGGPKAGALLRARLAVILRSFSPLARLNRLHLHNAARSRKKQAREHDKNGARDSADQLDGIDLEFQNRMAGIP